MLRVAGKVAFAGALVLIASACAGVQPRSTTATGAVPSVVDSEGLGLPPRCRDLDVLSGELLNPEVAPLGATTNPDESTRVRLADLAAAHPDTFAGLWIDREVGAIAMAFTDDLGERAGEMLTIAGEDVRLVVVEASYTEAEQFRFGNQIAGELLADDTALSVGRGVQFGRTTIELPVYDRDLARALGDRYDADRICVDGLDPELVIPEGPQPTEGDGWRLLVDAPGEGRPWASGFADDVPSLEALWDTIGLTEPIPTIDFEEEAVIWFGPAVSGSCPDIRLDAVVFDAADRVVYPVIVLPGVNQACTADANPHAYVLAVDRAILPNRPFTIDVTKDPCETASGVCEEQRTLVTEP